MQHPMLMGLNGFGLEVPDLTVARAFYVAFGLDITSGEDVLTVNSPGRNQGEGILLQGTQKKLHHVSFYTDPAMLAPFADRLRAYGLEVTDSGPLSALRPGLWFQDPWGTWIHITGQAPAAPRAETNLPGNDPNTAHRVDIALWREHQAARPPLRLGHMLMFTPDWEKAEAFFCDILGMRVSDRAAGKVSFLAAGHGVIDHHCFGLINSSHRGYQHASFQVPGMDDIGYGAWQMADAGFRDSFGPGRHAIASNLFHYFRDPWGSWVEYYADMDKISDKWVSQDWSNLPYVWGPEWSPEFWGGEMNANLEPA